VNVKHGLNLLAPQPRRRVNDHRLDQSVNSKDRCWLCN
jgi:hypothetical protein